MSTYTNEPPTGQPAQSGSSEQTGAGTKQEHTWTERIEMTGGAVVEQLKKLIAEGNVRRVIIRNDKGDSLVEIPLTAGVVVSGALVWAYPVLAAIGALAALMTHVKVDVIRTTDVTK